jgi:hypothetical protein
VPEEERKIADNWFYIKSPFNDHFLREVKFSIAIEIELARAYRSLCVLA